MRISYEMDLYQLMERMGESATIEEAHHMREALVGLGAWEDTQDIPENIWNDLLDAVSEQARIGN